MAETRRIARVTPSTVYRELQGKIVLLQSDSGDCFALDHLETRVWQLIVEKGDLQAVEAAVLEEFEVDQISAARDLSRLVDELVQRGLIEVDSRSLP